MFNFAKTLFALVMIGTGCTAFAIEGESIVFDPATGNYLITHYSEFGKKFEKLVFIPSTKINPTLKSKFKQDEGEIVRYEYMLLSGRDSQQVTVGLLLDPVSSVTSSLPDIPLNASPGKIMGDMMSVAKQFDTPALWYSTMAYSKGQMAFRIGWLIKVANGLTPGSKAVFGFRSLDLPGIIQARVDGYAPNSQEIDGEEIPDSPKETGDDPFWKQYFSLMNNDFVRRFAAVPTISVPEPFDAAVLLERIQTQMHTWIGMNLLDATFSSQLDRSFQSAISAYRLNQPKVGKQQIQTMRALIKKEQPNLGQDEEHESDKSQGNDDNKKALIDRLAASVLDFDLEYVTKRMDGDD
jgi:hypothetical protein